MASAQKNCDKESIEKGLSGEMPSNIPILVKFSTYGLEWKLPEKDKDTKMDATSLLKCLDSQDGIPAEVFGNFRSPFDVKEMYFGQNGK